MFYILELFCKTAKKKQDLLNRLDMAPKILCWMIITFIFSFYDYQKETGSPPLHEQENGHMMPLPLRIAE